VIDLINRLIQQLSKLNELFMKYIYSILLCTFLFTLCLSNKIPISNIKSNYSINQVKIEDCNCAIYNTVINEIIPNNTQSILILDSTINDRYITNDIRGDILAKFNSEIVYNLYKSWSNVNIDKQLINCESESKIIHNNKNVSYTHLMTNLNFSDTNTYKLQFTNIGYINNRQYAILYVKYDRSDEKEGGSSVLILEDFWGKWNIIHISEVSAY